MSFKQRDAGPLTGCFQRPDYSDLRLFTPLIVRNLKGGAAPFVGSLFISCRRHAETIGSEKQTRYEKAQLFTIRYSLFPFFVIRLKYHIVTVRMVCP